MIELLQKLVPEILESFKELYYEGDVVSDSVRDSVRDYVDNWDSLVIDRRKPHTYRMFRKFGEYRVCLHRFEPCKAEEAFPHPHPWSGAFLLLDGEYIHTVGGSSDLESDPQYYLRELVRPDSIYEITNPLTWHKVQPLKRTYTIMVNGDPWEESHNETRTTKGKDLIKMSPDEKLRELQTFNGKLSRHYIRTFESSYKDN